MATYSVSFEKMDFVHSEMESITKQIQQTLADLDDESKQRLAEWTTDARDAYNRAKAKWDAAAADMQRQALAAQVALGQIGDSYRGGESTGLQIWGQ
jgi:WXG100 family type VII secretion target